MEKMTYAFNKPYMTGKEIDYIRQAHATSKLSGNGYFTQKCQSWLQTTVSAKRAFLTQSCTSSLEMAAILIDIQPGDEIIMPSYTFVSTANAFALRGGIPVFVDINPDTLNIDEKKIEAAITPKTKAIVPVHYAGVSCEMDTIMDIANEYKLYVIEDAAQALMSSYKNRPVGSMGHLAAFSFHETKNIISGEGGALLINDENLIEKAEFIWEKGTNRKSFFLGHVDKYTWVSLGSSFQPSEITAAFLWAQLEEANFITEGRRKNWQHYHCLFSQLAENSQVKRPNVAAQVQHNGHIYYLLLKNEHVRMKMISTLAQDGINALFHYIPLHSAPAGKVYGRQHGQLTHTDSIAQRIIRMPLYLELKKEMITYICDRFIARLEELSMTRKEA